MTNAPLTPYPLPGDVRQTLLDLAAECDVLILGELHGTQEVPQLALGLLPDLAGLGYRGLALEIPEPAREGLASWATGATQEPPEFFTRPGEDGRGNVQALSLVKEAATQGWTPLCFDMRPGQAASRWADRDAWMAHNRDAQWRRLCPDAKVLGVCGNFHSRLTNRATPDSPAYDFWLSFAAALQAGRPEKVVHSVNVMSHEGGFFNGGRVQELTGEPLAQPAARHPHDDHTVQVHLPRATPATFLAEPRS